MYVTNQQWGSVVGVITKLLYADQLYLVIQSEETGKLHGVPASVCTHIREGIPLRQPGIDEQDEHGEHS